MLISKGHEERNTNIENTNNTRLLLRVPALETIFLHPNTLHTFGYWFVFETIARAVNITNKHSTISPGTLYSSVCIHKIECGVKKNSTSMCMCDSSQCMRNVLQIHSNRTTNT